MKSKSTLFLLTGIALGAISAMLLRPSRRMQHGKQELKMSRKYDKAFKEAARKYRKKFQGQESN
jgi:gas vesicle protein